MAPPGTADPPATAVPQDEYAAFVAGLQLNRVVVLPLDPGEHPDAVLAALALAASEIGRRIEPYGWHDAAAVSFKVRSDPVTLGPNRGPIIVRLDGSKSLAAIGAEIGLSRERVRQLVHKMGYTSTYAAARKRYLAAARQLAAAARRKTAMAGYATCGHCHIPIKGTYPKADGRPSFCGRTMACRAARVRNYRAELRAAAKGSA